MPFAPSKMVGNTPTKPHLAVYTDDAGDVLALPPGARFLLIEDPSRVDRIYPLILKRVSKTALVFQCGCGRCNREYTFKLTDAKGLHRRSPTLSARAPASAKPES